MFSDVIGHKDIIERLKSAMRSGRIANAYIFSGPAEVGKEFVAMNFAKALNCLSHKGDACDKCISCRKINDGNHPDVRLIRPESNKLKIDQIQDLIRQGSYKAVEGNYKVYIIASAEKMTLESANSLLKNLEEPPGAQVFILLTTEDSALLPTIRSRCQSFKFSLIPQETMKDELMKRFSLSESRAKWLASSSGGRVGRALKLADSVASQSDEEIPPFLKNFGQKGTPPLLIFKKAEELSRTEGSLDALLSWYRDLLLIKQGCRPNLLIHSDKKEELEVIARKFGDVQLERAIKTILMTQNLIQRNINPVLAMEVMILHLLNTLSARL